MPQKWRSPNNPSTCYSCLRRCLMCVKATQNCGSCALAVWYMWYFAAVQMFWTRIIHSRTTWIFHNRQCGLLHLSRLHSAMPTSRANDTGCSRSTDRLQTDGGQVRDTLKVDHWRERQRTAGSHRRAGPLSLGRFLHALQSRQHSQARAHTHNKTSALSNNASAGANPYTGKRDLFSHTAQVW